MNASSSNRPRRRRARCLPRRQAVLLTAAALTAAGTAAASIAEAGPAPRRAAAASAVRADAGGLAVAFTTTAGWDTGYSAAFTLRNTGATARHGWRLEFDLPGGTRITSLWEGTASGTTGHVTVTPASWNADVAPGSAVTVGFVAARAGDTAGPPTGCTVDGVSCTASASGTPSTAPSTTAPSATAPSATRPPVTSTTATSSTSSTSTSRTSTSSTTSTTAPTSTPAGGGARSAPYVDTSLYPAFDLAGWSAGTGTKEFTLAFIVSGGGCTPKWGGVSGLDADQVAAQIPKVRAAGGDVRVSFGGAAGSELALVCPDATSLADAYGQVVDHYGLTRIDLDVEGSATANTAANARRGQALAALQKKARAAGRQLRVSLTLPVLPSGLTADGLGVVRATAAAGVDIDAVNVMAMDYGDGAAPNPSGQMGRYAIDAATATQKQVAAALGLGDAAAWARIAVTPMIGVNDTSTEVFTTADARQLVDFARTVHLGWLAFWSAARDRACPGGPQSWASATCSGIAQQTGDFSRAFAGYTG